MRRDDHQHEKNRRLASIANAVGPHPHGSTFVGAQARYYHHTIKCFGAERCMFESNFPVDRRSLSYHVLWNGLKKIAATYSEEEQMALFSGTASRVYKLV